MYVLLGVLLGYSLRWVQVEYRKFKVRKLTKPIFLLIDEGRLSEAALEIVNVERKLGTQHPELTRASSLINFLNE